MHDQDDVTRSIPTRLGDLSVRAVGSGAPVVCWPSLFADSRTWHRLREPLAREHRVILIDGPSHGGSSPTRHRFTLADCAGAAISNPVSKPAAASARPNGRADAIR